MDWRVVCIEQTRALIHVEWTGAGRHVLTQRKHREREGKQEKNASIEGHNVEVKNANKQQDGNHCIGERKSVPGANTGHVMCQSFVAVQGLNGSVFVIEAFDF